MSDDLDLNIGDPSRGDAASERRRRRRSTAKQETESVSGPTESELRHQLSRAFDGLASSRETRNDFELAAAIREEGEAMTDGFVTLTNNVKPLRFPVVIALNLLITLLAFGRVGGILLGRLQDRRARRQAERAAAMSGATEYYGDEDVQ